MLETKTKSKEQLTEEVRSFHNERNKLLESHVEKWAKAKNIGGSDLVKLWESNPAKARRVALSISNVEQRFKRMTESVMAQSFGTTLRPENFLKAVYIGTALSKRGDIFTEFPLQSTDDALIYINMTREQTLRDGTAGQKMYETISQYYAGEQYTGSIGTGDGANLTFTSGAMSPLALIPYSVRILVDGAQVGVDNGGGVISGTTITSASSSVDYATGIITVVFSAGNAPANGAAITCIYNWNSEDSNNYQYYGTVGIGLQKIRFSARPMPLGYRVTDFTDIMFETTGMGSAMEYLQTAVGHEHAKAKDFRAIARARQVALGNTRLYFDTDFASAGEVSYKTHAQRVTYEINKATVAIQDDIQRGGINKIIAGNSAANYLSLHDSWDYNGADSLGVSGVRKAGNLGQAEVYTCPADSGLVATNDMLLVYKNPEEGMDISIVFGVLSEIDASLRYPQFYTEGNSACIEDAKTVNSKFVRLMTLQNL